MKRFFKILLSLFGLFVLGLAIFAAIRIRENDQKAALRQAEAEKTQISEVEAQQLDLGGFKESDFRLPAEPPGHTPAPTPEQWQALRQALAGATPSVPLPPQPPVISSGFGHLRYALKPGSWRVQVDCRPGDSGQGCEPVTLSVATLSEAEADQLAATINILAQEEMVLYGALHGRRGTEGLDKLIREGDKPMIYSEFCSELGCNGSVTFAVGKVMVKIEGSGDLQPWFTALIRSGREVGKR